MSSLPFEFLDRLKLILPPEVCLDVLRTFSRANPTTVRINTLKISREEILSQLKDRGIAFRTVGWSPEALVLEGITQKDLGETEWAKQGLLYSQNLSSMLPVLALAPKPGENVLDMCAAPGSKTTQIAACLKNSGRLVAVEAVRDRFYRLKAVCEYLGAGNVEFKLMDARGFRFTGEYFDRILVDASCSSEGRFRTSEPKSFAYWSPRKIREMVQKQRGILMTASHLLRPASPEGGPGGVLVYSTCTFAPEENEGVVDWLLRKSKVPLRLEPVEFDGVARYPALRQWGQKDFSPQVDQCFRVLPNDLMEGFFIAKFVRAA